jgi:hypothetical protein
MMGIGRLVSFLLLLMGIAVFIKGTQGGRISLGKGAFKRRLMRFQGRETKDGSRFFKQGLNNHGNRRGLLPAWRNGPEIEKRSNWRK